MNFVLSEEKRSEIISNYSNIAWKTVHRFSKGRVASEQDREDLHQECMIVLLRHLNMCQSDQDVYRFQAMDMVNAMARYTLGLTKFSNPRTTEAYRELIERQPETVPYCTLLNEPGRGSFEDSAITMIDFERMCESLTEKQKGVVIRKLTGSRNREIAKEDGVPEACVSKVLKRVRRRACDQMGIPASVKRRRS